MCLIIAFLLCAYIAYRLYQHFVPSPSINPAGKYVLISGCDTGFGHGLALELDQQGFNVLAGIYNAESKEALTNALSSRAIVFQLDITKQEDIDAAYEMISSRTKALHALVNNAGVGAFGYIDWITVESMRKLMDVNFFGHVTITKKFLPLLLAKKDSRVVNICSVAGYLVAPGMVSYSASKFALEAFSDCLRREMIPWHLRVSIIEPGFMKTPIVQGHDTSLQTLWSGLADDVKHRWGHQNLLQQTQDISNNLLIKYAERPHKVVNALKHAVMNTKPCIRYRPGLQSSLLFPMSLAPAWLADQLIEKLNRSSVTPSGVRNQLHD